MIVWLSMFFVNVGMEDVFASGLSAESMASLLWAYKVELLQL